MKNSTAVSPGTITFYGDSIFYNRPYVYSDAETVVSWANRAFKCPTRMEAIDGHVTHQLLTILSKLPELVYPTAGDCISIGSNEALQAKWIMNMPAKTVGIAFQEMPPVLDNFRRKYFKVLEAALTRFAVSNL